MPLPDSDLWVITLRLPSAWQASYLFVEWKEETAPPWYRLCTDNAHPAGIANSVPNSTGNTHAHASNLDANKVDTNKIDTNKIDTNGRASNITSDTKFSGVMHHHLIELGQPDPRNPLHIPTRGNRIASVARGPHSLKDPWFAGQLSNIDTYPIALTGTPTHILMSTPPPSESFEGETGKYYTSTKNATTRTHTRVDTPIVTTVQLPHAINEKTTVWVHQSHEIDTPVPLLVLFDGGMWNGNLHLPSILERATSRGILPPLAVAMIDAHTMNHRWNNVGVPAGQVDFLLDQVLPWVHNHCNVRPDAASTIVAGQSLGGLSALWSLALGEDRIGHAIAQSPALWRFSIAGSLLANRQWMSAILQAGTYEQRTHHLTADLARTLKSDPQHASPQHVEFQSVEGGHDWAWWRVALLHSVSRLLAPSATGGNW